MKGREKICSSTIIIYLNCYRIDITLLIFIYPFQFHGISSIQNYNYNYNTTWSSQFSNISDASLFDEVTHTFGDLIENVTIRFFRANENDKFIVSLKTNTSRSALRHVDVVEQQHRKFGKCYSILPRKKYRKLGIYYIKLML